MTRQERLEKAEFEVFLANWDDTEFYIEDGSTNNLYLNFYLNNDNTPKVDVFIIDNTPKVDVFIIDNTPKVDIFVITEPKAFNPETFDVINGVPDVTLFEDELWNRVKEGWIIW